MKRRRHGVIGRYSYLWNILAYNKKLYDEIIQLPVRDVNILGALVLQILGQKVYPGEFGHHTPLPEGMMEAAAAAAAAEQEEVVEEAKTIFDVKLVGFDAKAKIKVIKEVRAITGLGLKEAKAKVDSHSDPPLLRELNGHRPRQEHITGWSTR